MESTLGNAVLLLAVGMITVFVILALVVATGSLLIRITNRMAPAPKPVPAHAIQPAHIAAMTAVVEHLTGGRGNIDSIEKK